MLTSLRDSFGSLSSRFAEIDKDGDGKISKGEFNGPPQLFSQIDADGDGVISRDEASRSQPAAGAAGANAGMFAQRLRAMDKDGDGKVSKEEFTGPPAIFDRLDADKDGAIGRDEIPGGAAPGAPAPANDRAMTRERLRAMDKNGDAQISKDEFDGPQQLFDRLDANKDGVISREDNPGSATTPAPAPRLRLLLGPITPPEPVPANASARWTRTATARSSKDEFTGPAAFFDRVDADKDGFITPQEVARAGGPGGAGAGAAGRGGEMAERLRAMDKDGDGKISKDEFSGPPQFFDRLDANSDGVLTPEEMRRSRPEPGKAKGARRRPGGNNT